MLSRSMALSLDRADPWDSNHLKIITLSFTSYKGIAFFNPLPQPVIIANNIVVTYHLGSLEEHSNPLQELGVSDGEEDKGLNVVFYQGLPKSMHCQHGGG